MITSVIDNILIIPEFKRQVKSFLSFKKEDLKCGISYVRERSSTFAEVALISIPKTVYDIVEINLLTLKNVDNIFTFDIKTIYSSIVIDNGEPYVNVQGNIVSLNTLQDRISLSSYIKKFEEDHSLNEDKNLQ